VHFPEDEVRGGKRPEGDSMIDECDLAIRLMQERELELLQPSMFDSLVLTDSQMQDYEESYTEVALSYFLAREAGYCHTQLQS